MFLHPCFYSIIFFYFIISRQIRYFKKNFFGRNFFKFRTAIFYICYKNGIVNIRTRDKSVGILWHDDLHFRWIVFYYTTVLCRNINRERKNNYTAKDNYPPALHEY